ncbi:hypothetical protein HDU67_000844 [Dinochytrium kinnereticum]|nr:hypothetical protein HDU67_000844 [Dinochytrium kinnereticum]
MKKSKRIKIILSVIALLLLAAAAVTVGVLNFKQGKFKHSQKFFTSSNSAERATLPMEPEKVCQNDESCLLCASHNILLIMGSVNLIDLSKKQFRMNLAFIPCGDLVGDFNVSNQFGNFYPIRAAMSLTVDNRVMTFNPGEVMPSQNLTLSFGSGDLNQYPFDKFESNNLIVYGTYFESRTNATIKLPIGIGMEAALLSYSVDVPVMKQYGQDGKNVLVKIAVTRSITTKFFSMMVISIMWTLSLLSLTLSTTLWLRDRKVEPPTLGLTTGLIFALPSLRNSQPNIPPIGCLADVVALFWTVSIATISVSLLYINYIIKYTKEKKSIAEKAKNLQSPNPFKSGDKINDAEVGLLNLPPSQRDSSSSSSYSSYSDAALEEATEEETIKLIGRSRPDGYGLGDDAVEISLKDEPSLGSSSVDQNLSRPKSFLHGDSLSSIYNAYSTDTRVPHSLSTASIRTGIRKDDLDSPPSSIEPSRISRSNDDALSSIYGAYGGTAERDSKKS